MSCASSMTTRSTVFDTADWNRSCWCKASGDLILKYERRPDIPSLSLCVVYSMQEGQFKETIGL